MERLLFFLLFSWATIASIAQDSLRLRLDSLLADPMFETSQVGLMVYDLTADSVLYQKNQRQMLRPASTMKLVTSITAIDRLGGDYQFRTHLCYTGIISGGKLTGDLYCIGGFDPMFNADDMNAFAESLRRLGVDTLQGRIMADLSMKESLDYGEGWCWDDKNPKLTPLSLGRNDTFVERLQEELVDKGIVLRDVTTGTGRCPARNFLVCTRFHTIDQVLRRMMKDSDNFYAESMFYQIAAASGNRPGKASDARNIVRQLIRKIGLSGNPYKIADGSGLSLYNYLSAELETLLLRYAWRHSNIYDLLSDALPIAAVDGTLKSRMKGTAAAGNVRAKTGTLTGISSLAGYCQSPDGHQLCFAIINQGVMRSALARTFQDRVCIALCSIPLSPQPPTQPSVDYEQTD